MGSVGKRQVRFYLSLLFVAGLSLVPIVAYAQRPPKPYTGAAIITGNDFTHGRYEIRLKSAAGSGIVSAFFLRASNKTPEGTLIHELDFEFMGKTTGLLHMACHQGVDNPSQGKRHETEKKDIRMPFDPSANFHTYAIEYTPEAILWLVDNREVWRLGKTMADKFEGAKMSLRCNIWSPNIKPWAGAIDRQQLPAQYEIDYVAYAEWTGASGSQAFKPVWKDEFEGSSLGRWSKANWTWGSNQADMKAENVKVGEGKVILLLSQK